MSVHPKITPFLWFKTEAEEAARFYTSIFPDSKITHVSHYLGAGEESHKQKPGSVMTVDFELGGQKFTALNGGESSKFTFDESISFVIDCKDQAEVDYFWGKLEEGGGQAKQCGWLADRFGLVWQVYPAELPKLLSSDDREAANRAMAAMMKMVKIDINAMKAAFEGSS